MKKVGVFGTCRIDDFNFDDFVKLTDRYPYEYVNKKFKINIRPLGYTTTSSDILQNLTLIKNKKHLEIKDDFIIRNVLYKHGGTRYIPDLDYDYLVLEICSIKKIIHERSGYIFPYEVEGRDPFSSEYTASNEDFDETVNNIIKIQEIMNCTILLIPPIYTFNDKITKGVHESCLPEKVLDHRLNILDRLTKAANSKNIILYDWNVNIKQHGADKMLKDQFHFNDSAKRYNLKQILRIIDSKKLYFSNEKVYINVPSDIFSRHRYYQMYPSRDNCEKYFRLLVKYLYDIKVIDKNKNIIDLGAWIGDNSIPWAINTKGIIYAIDPSDENINFIEELKYLNNITNVKTIKECISDKTECVYTNDDIKHAEFTTTSGINKINTVTLDSLFENNTISNVGFIHLDVEGFEHKVLSGCLKLIEKCSPFIVWENHLGKDDYNKTGKLLEDFEYKSYLINEFFPHCHPTCRNFISIPKQWNYIVNDVDCFFSKTENRPELHKNFLIPITF